MGLPAIFVGIVKNQNNSPIAGAIVNLGSMSSESLSNGYYLIMAPSGTYTLSATYEGTTTTPQSVTGTAGNVTTTNLTFTTASTMYMTANQTLTVGNNNVTIYGNSGGVETVNISGAPAGVLCNANVNRVNFPSDPSKYWFLHTGTQIHVYYNNTSTPANVEIGIATNSVIGFPGGHWTFNQVSLTELYVVGQSGLQVRVSSTSPPTSGNAISLALIPN